MRGKYMYPRDAVAHAAANAGSLQHANGASFRVHQWAQCLLNRSPARLILPQLPASATDGLCGNRMVRVMRAIPVAYSIFETPDGTWKWTIYPRKVPGLAIVRGTSKSQREARAAIAAEKQKLSA
jgi:hypothetical protein